MRKKTGPQRKRSMETVVIKSLEIKTNSNAALTKWWKTKLKRNQMLNVKLESSKNKR